MPKRLGFIGTINKHKTIYLLLLPTVVFFLIFAYLPYFGLTLAFKDYKIYSGLWASPWVGLKHFEAIFSTPGFFKLISNTVIISLMNLVFGFPMPIIFALLLNEVRLKSFKKSIQTISFFPNFMSWVIYGGIIMLFIKPTGVINTVLATLGAEQVNLITNPAAFRMLLVGTNIMKNTGFSAIIYLAALTNIDPQLYEAAIVDGAKKSKQLFHITLPEMMPLIITMFILALSGILNANFEQIFVLYNPAVYEVADVIDTYIYRIGIQGAQYSVTTAIGLFRGLVGFVLIYASNTIIRRMNSGIFTLW
jgi:putative aldouronate transport system permease protein